MPLLLFSTTLDSSSPQFSASASKRTMSTAEPKKKKGWGGGFNRFIQSVQTTVESKQEEIRLAKEAKEVGKVWDKEKKAWVFYFIDQELEEIEQLLGESSAQTSAHGSDAGVAAERPVADREYYDLLDVSTNADDAVIRKAYFKAARKCHPDKNPDDPKAHERFQELGHAYQVLSNPEKRAAYDRDGKSENTAGDNMEEVDPFVFFNVMFGSGLVEPYIGELWIASTSDSVMKDGSSLNEEELEAMDPEQREEFLHEHMSAVQQKNDLKQKLRQVKCAQNLRKRIADFDEANPDAFIQSAREEAVQIAQGAYGALYLKTIGFSLQVAAEEFLGFEKSFWGLSGHMARTRKNASSLGSNFKLIGAGFKAAGAGSRAMQEAEKMQQQNEEQKERSDQAAQEQQMAETIDESLPAFLELAWAINQRDIKSTLHKVCEKVFQDASVPKELRFVRAKAVRALGKEFQTVAKLFQAATKDQFDAEDIKARVAVATMTTMAKAQGQEVTEEDQQEMIQQAKQMSLNPKQYASEEEYIETETPPVSGTTATEKLSASDIE